MSNVRHRKVYPIYMQRNPYSPPSSPESEASIRAPSRPISAWLVLALLVAASAIFAFGTARLCWLVASGALEVKVPLLAAKAIAWRIALATAGVAIGLAVYRRTPQGRWFGLAAIVGFAAWHFLGQDGEQYPNKAQEAGAFIGKFFISPFLFLWWSYAFAFSAKSKKYFSKRNGDA